MTGAAEVILRTGDRDVWLLVASDDLTIMRSLYAAGQQVAGPHVHHDHTDAFYVLEGTLIFELGPGAETTTVSAGGFVAVPPGVAHAFRTGDHQASWLTIHAPDGGFASFMRGIRDGVEVVWDFWPVSVGGGVPADRVVVRVSE